MQARGRGPGHQLHLPGPHPAPTGIAAQRRGHIAGAVQFRVQLILGKYPLLSAFDSDFRCSPSPILATISSGSAIPTPCSRRSRSSWLRPRTCPLPTGSWRPSCTLRSGRTSPTSPPRLSGTWRPSGGAWLRAPAARRRHLRRARPGDPLRGRRAPQRGRLGLTARLGIHVGEVELAGAEVTGVSIRRAAEIAALARPGEILVSRTVSDLVAGSEIAFADRAVVS